MEGAETVRRIAYREPGAGDERAGLFVVSGKRYSGRPAGDWEESTANAAFDLSRFEQLKGGTRS